MGVLRLGIGVIIFLSSLSLFTGCAALVIGGIGAAAGVGGYHYYQGELTANINTGIRFVWEGTKKAIKDLGYTIEEESHSETKGKIKASKSGDEPITVTLKYISSDKTEVGIRVGLFGDKDRSAEILQRIKTASGT